MMKALALPFQLTRSDPSPVLPPAACHIEIGSCLRWDMAESPTGTSQTCSLGRCLEMDCCKTPTSVQPWGGTRSILHTEMAYLTTLLRIMIGDY